MAKSPKKTVRSKQPLPAESKPVNPLNEELNQSHKPVGIPSLLCLSLAVYLCWTAEFQSPNMQFGICLACCIIGSGKWMKTNNTLS